MEPTMETSVPTPAVVSSQSHKTVLVAEYLVVAGGVVIDKKAALRNMSDRDIEREAARRDLIDDWGDWSDSSSAIDCHDVMAELRAKNVPEALWKLENAMRDAGVQCAGFAEQVAVYFAKKHYGVRQ